MKKILQRMILSLGRIMPGMIFLLLTRPADANPTGMTVQSGHATATVSGARLTVTAGNNAVLNWQSFNIAAGETTVFNQPSASSIVWNRIGGQSPSQIYGSLQANGIVVLLNSSGFYFGPNAYVSAAGLVVSTANCLPPQNGGGAWEFNGPPPLASIVNYGEIQIGQHGSCYLIADQVENHGTITAPGGSVGLAAGQTVLLSDRPDGRGLSMNVTLPQGSVDNYGTVLADGGTIALNAKVVNQNGLLQANSVKDVNGVIELVAGDQLNLGPNSQLTAQGDASPGGSPGGSITLKSDNSFEDAVGSRISVAGGANGGNGGALEISAASMSALHSTVDGSAHAGSTGGQLLLDPDEIILDSYGGDSAGSTGTVQAGDGSGTLDLNIYSAFAGLASFATVTLQAKDDITLADYTYWDLSGTMGKTSGNLVLEAGNNIILSPGSSLSDGNQWSVSLYAGMNFANNTVSPGIGAGSGTGSIYLNGILQTAAGDINLVAANDIIVGNGYVNTTEKGNIYAHALAGNIDTGDYAQGYRFLPGSSMANAYYVDTAGGISTTAGGNVTLVAGGDVTSLLPIQGGYCYDYNGTPVSDVGDANAMTAGSGTYGAAPGNFTIVAGGDVTGNYEVANGIGKIFAGVLMNPDGTPQTDGSGKYVLGTAGDAGLVLGAPEPGVSFQGTPLSLGLINGQWNVTAANNIVLQEVNNPNGDFNANSGAVNHQFNYGATAQVNLTAGNQVQIGATASLLARLDPNVPIPIILPPVLNVTAGAGGVLLVGDAAPYNQIILFPSPSGSLTIDTTAGGSLSASSPSIFNLIVSDSGNTQYNRATAASEGLSIDSLFGLNDHAATPVHLGSETALSLNIAGDMNNILLGAPEAAQIAIGGNMYNCGFQGMNLADDVTSINVTGNIKNDPGYGTGYLIGGGGWFDITAHDVDLGTTPGIQSWGVGLYNQSGTYPLANVFNTGADIQMNLSGDLDMISSSVASFNGGSISISAQGSIEAGSPTAVTALGARGIYSTRQGDVTVVAGGDIDVNGSRIATFDGGNITVESLHGDINAGSGGGGFVVVSSYHVDPTTHAVTSYSPTIPGSGILATTFPNDKNQLVGNILVETPNGNIVASAGGIIQSPLNGNKANRNAIAEVLAGYELRDDAGNALTAGDLGSGKPVQVSDNANIDASGSGIIAENVVGEATGTFKGVVFGANNVTLTSPQFSSLVVLGEHVGVQGSVGPDVTVIGTQSADVSGSGNATVLSADANGGGSTFAQGTAANATSTAASAASAAATTAAAKSDTTGTDDDENKKKKPIALARKVSRVTVILPGKN